MKVLLATVAIAVSGAAFWFGQAQFLAAQNGDGRANAGAPAVLDPASVQLMTPRATAAMAGVTPETACAAGLSLSDVETVLAAIRDSEDRAALSAAAHALDQSMAEVTRLDTLIAKGGGTQETLAERAAAIVAVNTAQDDMASARAALRSAATAILPEGAQRLLLRITENARWRVPTHFHVFDAAEGDWALIELAFRRYEAAIAQDEPLDGESAQILDVVTGDPGVVAAAARLQQTFAEFEAAFNEFD